MWDVMVLHSRLRDSDAMINELSTRNTTLENALREKETQLAHLSSNLTNSENKMLQFKSSNDELLGVNDRYKHQLTQAREDIRRYEDERKANAMAVEEAKKVCSGHELMIHYPLHYPKPHRVMRCDAM